MIVTQVTTWLLFLCGYDLVRGDGGGGLALLDMTIYIYTLDDLEES